MFRKNVSTYTHLNTIINYQKFDPTMNKIAIFIKNCFEYIHFPPKIVYIHIYLDQCYYDHVRLL